MRSWYTRLRHSRDAIPLVLLAGFLLFSFITVLTQAHRYGITLDESLQELYGRSILKWYATLGRNTSFLTGFRPAEHMPEHGGIFDAGVVATQVILKHFDPHIDVWLVRHLLTGLMGWVGVVGIALCGLELGGPWVALVSAVGLWLFPRYYGAMYNNPKDVPATACLTFVIWATILLVKHWERRKVALWLSVLLGCCLGVATAIRVTSLSWVAVLAILLAGWWLIHGRAAWREQRIGAEVARQGLVGLTIGVSTLLTTMALWPFVFVNPMNLFESISVLSHYPWVGPVLLDGTIYQSTQLPVSYVPTWIVIGSPPILLALALLGGCLILFETVRRRRIDAVVWIAPIGFMTPVAPLLLLHPVLYDTLRQFLYIFPPLILVGAYGLVRGVSVLLSRRAAASRWAVAALLAVTIVGYAQVTAEMIALSPYEYMYFSPLIGGLKGAVGNYETDYYASCTIVAAQWLAQNYQHYTSAASPTLDASYLIKPAIDPVLPHAVHYSDQHPDFFIGFTRYHNDQEYPTYRVIDVVASEGVPLCVVKVNPQILG